MGDRVGVMERGRLVQVATPLEVYRRPRNRFVAGFVGTPPMSFLEGGLEDDGGDAALPRPAASGCRCRPSSRGACAPRIPTARRARSAIRPEAVEIARPNGGPPSAGGSTSSSTSAPTRSSACAAATASCAAASARTAASRSSTRSTSGCRRTACTCSTGTATRCSDERGLRPARRTLRRGRAVRPAGARPAAHRRARAGAARPLRAPREVPRGQGAAARRVHGRRLPGRRCTASRPPSSLASGARLERHAAGAAGALLAEPGLREAVAAFPVPAGGTFVALGDSITDDAGVVGRDPAAAASPPCGRAR